MGNTTLTKLESPQSQGQSKGTQQKRSNSMQLNNGKQNIGRNAKKNAFNAIETPIQTYANQRIKTHHKYIEGHLMKYKPLINSKYIQRYCLITLTDFICCNKEWNAYSYACKPILQIPINSIEVVHR